MASANKVILLGNLGKDPEVKKFENGGESCSFTLATTESYWDKEKSQRVDLPTDWHNIRIGQPGLSKVAQQYLKKGSQVYVEGTLRNRQYQTKEGETRNFIYVDVANMVLTGSRTSDSAKQPSTATVAEPQTPAPSESDDLPF